MPDLNTILSAGTAGIAANRAALAWRRISEKPYSIVIKRGTTTLSAQTVRLESSSSSNRAGTAGTVAVREVVVFGVKGHATVTDTNIRRADRFVYGGEEYQVNDLVLTLGEVQARCEVIS
jgi:hypothetical protein